MQSLAPCPFCSLPAQRVLAERPTAWLIRDGFPINPGHCLVIPKRHVGSWFEATEQERADLTSLLDEGKALVDAEFAPAAYNIGINDGPAAGQTISHLHVHLIPRFPDDVADPRGGVRWLIPERADYWSGRARD